MKTYVLGATLAVGLIFGSTSVTHAQISVSVGNPYTGTGVYVGNPYSGQGFSYSSGYAGYAPVYGGTSYVVPNRYVGGYVGTPVYQTNVYRPAYGYRRGWGPFRRYRGW